MPRAWHPTCDAYRLDTVLPWTGRSSRYNRCCTSIQSASPKGGNQEATPRRVGRLQGLSLIHLQEISAVVQFSGRITARSRYETSVTRPRFRGSILHLVTSRPAGVSHHSAFGGLAF